MQFTLDYLITIAFEEGLPVRLTPLRAAARCLNRGALTPSLRLMLQSKPLSPVLRALSLTVSLSPSLPLSLSLSPALPRFLAFSLSPPLRSLYLHCLLLVTQTLLRLH